MQVTETVSDGLKRELRVTIPQGELTQRFASRLDEVKDQVQIKGFRKGKVPLAHLKKLYGRSLMAEVLQQALEETSRNAIKERSERAAHQPNIKLSEDEGEIERVLSGQGDLAFTLSYEALPKIELVDLAAIELEREVADVTEEAIDKGIASLAERAVRYEPEPDRAAGDGDRLTIDYLGRIDGQEFEGGKGEDAQIVVGEGGFIPGFVEGLAGAKAGEERLVKAKFPDPYPNAELAGKDAAFEVKVKEVARPVRPTLDDEFAKTLGVESFAKLREAVAARIQHEYAAVARMKLKQQVLDALDKAHDFALPETLVASEFEAIWRQVTESLAHAGRTFADEGKTEEGARAEYRKLAERRVRLGLVIGEIGDRNKMEVSDEEMRRALVEEANRYPGRQRMVYEFYQKNPGALVNLRAPIFEEKVVDHILAKAKVTDRKVTAEDLLKAVEAGDDLPHEHGQGEVHHHHDHAHDHAHDHGHDHDHAHGHDHHGHGHEHHGHQQGRSKE